MESSLNPNQALKLIKAQSNIDIGSCLIKIALITPLLKRYKP